MRKIYRLKIKIKGYFVNPITGDQLNGGFLYYLSLVNKEMFNLFFEEFIKNQPPFVFSSFLPSGYLPINSQFLTNHLFSDLLKDESKIIKKIKFIPAKYFSELSNLKKDELLMIAKEKIIIEEKLAKVSIKNDTLYNQGIISYTSKYADVYFSFSNFEFDDISSYLEEYLAYFVGKKVSAGFSNFSLFSSEKLENLGSGDYLINLSTFIPKKEEANLYQPLFFDFFTKYPKLGNLFDGGNPFKKKIILVKEGSVFKKKTKEKLDYAGLSLDNISLSFPQSRQLCFTNFYQFSL